MSDLLCNAPFCFSYRIRHAPAFFTKFQSLLKGTTSLLPNNLVTFVNDKNDTDQVLPIVATKQAVLVGEKSRVKIETG